MPKFNHPLNNIRVASPCPADWDAMYGDDRKRFCGECKLNVYNLSGMNRDEAEALITNAEGRLCVRFYRRADGTVITSDCPVGWAKVRQRTRLILAASFSMLMALFTGVLFASIFRSKTAEVTLGVLARPTPTPVVPTMGAMRPIQGKPSMGEIATPNDQDRQKKFEKGKQRALAQDEQRSDG
jgi:hypothetical protein